MDYFDGIDRIVDIILWLFFGWGAVYLIYIIYHVVKAKREGKSGGYTAPVTKPRGDQHKEYISVDGPMGSKIHYDGQGKFVGTSECSAFGDDMIHYDADGNYAGRSSRGFFDGQVIHTDADGRYAGQSAPGLFGATVHVDRNGRTGVTHDSVFGDQVTDTDPFEGE